MPRARVGPNVHLRIDNPYGFSRNIGVDNLFGFLTIWSFFSSVPGVDSAVDSYFDPPIFRKLVFIRGVAAFSALLQTLGTHTTQKSGPETEGKGFPRAGNFEVAPPP